MTDRFTEAMDGDHRGPRRRPLVEGKLCLVPYAVLEFRRLAEDFNPRRHRPEDYSDVEDVEELYGDEYLLADAELMRAEAARLTEELPASYPDRPALFRNCFAVVDCYRWSPDHRFDILVSDSPDRDWLSFEPDDPDQALG